MNYNITEIILIKYNTKNVTNLDDICVLRNTCLQFRDIIDNSPIIQKEIYYIKDCNTFKDKWNNETFKIPIKNNDLRLVKYLHKNGCPWNEYSCTYASLYGYLEVLKYLHENGCLWDSRSCSAASDSGHLDILKYLHENGCPWDEWSCSAASESGHLEVLKYLHENGCPCSHYQSTMTI